MKLFAKTCEELLNESSSLKKIEIITESIKQIQKDKELELFCLFLTGKVYPASVQKTINVGKAWVRDSILNLKSISKEEWDKKFRETGESGDTVAFFIQDQIAMSGISLEELESYIEKINQTSKSLAKVEILTEIFSKVSPLEGKYIAKLLLQNLRIGVQEATVEDAIGKAFDVKRTEVKQINFYLGNISEVAIRCKYKNFENIEFKLFHPIKAMLASAEVEVDEIFNRMKGQVWAEYKYDGIRSHIHKSGNKVEIYTRDLKRITLQFPEVSNFFAKVEMPEEFMLDGEIVPYSGGKIQPFAFIQKRLGRKENIEAEVEKNPTIFIAYDYLVKNGELFFGKSLYERRKLLEIDFEKTGLNFSTKKIVNTPDEFLDFFKASKAEGREGLMIKNPDSKYESGRRGIHWLKYKQTMDPLDVVIMKAEYGEGKNAKYLSNFTFGVWNESKSEIIPVGRVYSGTTEEDLKYFTEYMPKIGVDKLENGYILKPEIILEVGFENIQKSARYSSGYAVRFPRVLRIRTGDKPIDEISTIHDVIRGWELLNNL